MTLLRNVAAAAAVLVVAASGVSAAAVLTVQSHVNVVHLDPEVKHDDTPPGITAINGGANILLIGSDTRVGQNAEPQDAAGARNDVTMLVHLSQDHGQLTVVSLPRDLMVPIPACTDPDSGHESAPVSRAMFNTSLGQAGPSGGIACVVKTVEAFTGLHIPYAGLITFDGVIQMSDALGGVTVCVARPIADGSFLQLPAGSNTLQGDQALAFLRTRHGVGDGSDLARISNQQVFLSSLLRKITTENTLSNPVALFKFANAASSNMTLSESLADPQTLVSLATALRGMSTSHMLLLQYPVMADPTNPNRLVADPTAAQELNQALQNDTRTTLAPNVVGRGAVPGDALSLNQGTGATAAPSPSSTTPITAAPPPESPTMNLPATINGQDAAQQTCSKGATSQ